MTVKELNEKDFYNYRKAPTALIYFYADWCPSCRVLNLIVNEIANVRADIPMGKINVGTEAHLASQFNIKSVPTLILFKEGTESVRSVGVTTKKAIIDMLN